MVMYIPYKVGSTDLKQSQKIHTTHAPSPKGISKFPPKRPRFNKIIAMRKTADVTGSPSPSDRSLFQV
jgi:hypothetical protein